MSYAEYASKQVPVLTRLAMMLRQIPAVQTALARLKVLFGNGTNPEPVVTDKFVASPLLPATDAIAICDAIEISDAATPEPTALLRATESEAVAVATTCCDEPVSANDAADVTDTAPVVAEPVVLLSSEPVAAPVSVDAFVADAPVVVVDEPKTQPKTEPKTEIIAPAVLQPADESDREALIRRRWRETGIRMWKGTGQSVLCIQGRVAPLPPKPGETMPSYDRLEFRLIDGNIVCEGIVVAPPER